MARNPTVTIEAVASAAEKISEAGGKVTLAAVRDAVGGGSFSTISPLLQAWRDAQDEREELAEVAVPEQVTTATQELAARVWKTAVEVARAGHDSLRRDLLDAQQRVEAIQAESAELVTILETERDEARMSAEAEVERREALEAEQADLQRRLNVSDVECARLGERIEAKTQAANLAAEQAREADLRLNDLRGDLAAARAQAAEATADLRKAREQLDAARAELIATQTDLGGARADLATERAQHVATRDRLNEAQASEGLATADALASRQERDQAVEAQKKMASRIEELENQLDDAEKATVKVED